MSLNTKNYFPSLAFTLYMWKDSEKLQVYLEKTTETLFFL